MDPQTAPSSATRLWRLARAQHGVVTRGQLLALDYRPAAIKHRVATGRLHPIRRGVYAVGRPELSRYGRLMAAVLACGPAAVISHRSAGALWGLHDQDERPIEVSVQRPRHPRPKGI